MAQAQICPSCKAQTLSGGFCSACGYPSHMRASAQAVTPIPVPAVVPVNMSALVLGRAYAVLPRICKWMRFLMWFLIVCAGLMFLGGLISLLKAFWEAGDSSNALEKAAKQAVLGTQFTLFCGTSFASAVLASFSLVIGWLAEVGPLIVLIAEKP